MSGESSFVAARWSPNMCTFLHDQSYEWHLLMTSSGVLYSFFLSCVVISMRRAGGQPKNTSDFSEVAESRNANHKFSGCSRVP